MVKGGSGAAASSLTAESGSGETIVLEKSPIISYMNRTRSTEPQRINFKAEQIKRTC